MKKLSYVFYLVLVCVFASCNTTSVMSLPENSEVVEISKSNRYAEYKYFVTTEDYNFWTNEEYKIGDTVALTNAKEHINIPHFQK